MLIEIISLFSFILLYKLFIKYYYIDLLSRYQKSIQSPNPTNNRNIFYIDLLTDEEKQLTLNNLLHPEKKWYDYILGYDISNSIIYTLLNFKNTYKNDSCLEMLNECKTYDEAKEKLVQIYGFDENLLDKIYELKEISDIESNDEYFEKEEKEIIPKIISEKGEEIISGIISEKFKDLSKDLSNIQNENPKEQVKKINELLNNVLSNFMDTFKGDFNMNDFMNAVQKEQ